ncbi:MAG: hypothetical protein ACI38Y_04565 [Candidatus Methanomethylophilaceae archaeon]
MAEKSARPVLITIIGAIYAIFGILYLLGGIIILAGVGFLCGWSIMWYLGIIFEALAIILDAMSLFVGNFSAVIPILVSLIIILYLFKPNVKRYFLE